MLVNNNLRAPSSAVVVVIGNGQVMMIDIWATLSTDDGAIVSVSAGHRRDYICKCARMQLPLRWIREGGWGSTITADPARAHECTG